ncbi:MAG: pilus assembly protein TadG-related protein [Hyphomicrobiales bacterium]
MVSQLARLWRCRDGSVAPFAALFAPVAAGFAALSIDVGIAYFERAEMQTAADAASLAAAMHLPDKAAARNAALVYAEKNMPAAEHGMVLAEEDIVFGTWDSSVQSFVANSGAPSAVSVTLRKTVERGNAVPTVFGRVLGYDTIEVGSSSKSSAVAGGASPLCMLVLDPDKAAAMDVRSRARINAKGCAAWVNSSNDKALVTAANSEIHFAQTCVAGGHDVDKNAVYQASPRTRCMVKQDP